MRCIYLVKCFLFFYIDLIPNNTKEQIRASSFYEVAETEKYSITVLPALVIPLLAVAQH